MMPGLHPTRPNPTAKYVLLACFLLLSFPARAQNESPPDPATVEARPDSLAQIQPGESEDEALAGRLRAIFDSIEVFRGVEVQVRSGVVRLTGLVDGEKQREDAEALASSLPGVLYVMNGLEANLELEARVTPAVERVQTYLSDAMAYLPVAGVAFVVLFVFWLLARWAGMLRVPFHHLGLSPMLQGLVARLLRVVIFLIGLVLALDILGITTLVGTVLGAAGLAGIAIGFAFQDIIENYLAGVLMSIRHPFDQDDFVKIGDVEGKVVRLTSRELFLMTPDGNHVRIPNGTVFKSTIYNYTLNPRRRFDFNVGVGVGEDLTRVQQIGLETLAAMRGVMDDPAPMMRVDTLGDSNVVVVFFGWVDQRAADFGKVRSEAIRLVKTALEVSEVLMPEPIFNVRMQQTADGISVAMAPGDDTGQGVRQPPKKQSAPPGVAEQARHADVEVDDHLGEQIREDRENSDEPNLLR